MIANNNYNVTRTPTDYLGDFGVLNDVTQTLVPRSTVSLSVILYVQRIQRLPRVLEGLFYILRIFFFYILKIIVSAHQNRVIHRHTDTQMTLSIVKKKTKEDPKINNQIEKKAKKGCMYGMCDIVDIITPAVYYFHFL